MVLDINRESLKQGVLGLVMALVEIIRDALRTEAFRRIEAGSLTEEECERLGRALGELDEAIDSIKREQGLEDAVQSVRDGLDDAVDDIVNRFINPRVWIGSGKRKKAG